MYGKWLYKEIGTEYGACMVEIYRKNYTGESIEIGALAADSLSIALENLGSITDPIGKSVCSFSIIDTDQVEYDDFFTPDATALKVVVSTRVGSGAYVTRWSGYVTPDFFAENLSYRTPISISARDNIGYLNDVDFDLTATTITVREFIQSAFTRIAEDYPMSLSFVSQKQTAEGILAIDATISTTLLRDMTWGEALETILHDLGLQMRWVDNNTIAVLDISQIPEYYATQGFNFIDASGYREIAPAWRQLAQEQSYGVRENFYEGQIDQEAKLEYVTTSQISTNILLYQPIALTQWRREGAIYLLNFFNGYNFDVDDNKAESLYITGVNNNVTITHVLATKLVYSQRVTQVDKQMKFTFNLNDTLREPRATSYNRGEADSIFYLPYSQQSGATTAPIPRPYQLKFRFNVFLRAEDGSEYVMREEWVNANTTITEQPFIEFKTKKLEVYNSGVNDAQGNPRVRYTSYDNEEEFSITIGSIPKAGILEFVVYPYTFVDDEYASVRDDATFQRGAKISDITFAIKDTATGIESNTLVDAQHNVKNAVSYSFGEVPIKNGDFLLYAGGLFNPVNLTALKGYQRNADATNYNLLELVGRELIHFNKRNYNRLSGTIRNLNKEPLMFNRLFMREGKKYAPYNYSLNVISNEMNITSMQEVEPYETATFNTIDSQITTGGGTVSGGNNTILQYSEEAGNEKRLYELQTATEQEVSDAYVLVDKAGFPEARKVHISELGGLNEFELSAYLEQYEYLQKEDVQPIIDNLASVTERVDVAEDALKTYWDSIAKNAVDIVANAEAIGKLDTRVTTLEDLGLVRVKEGDSYYIKSIYSFVSEGEIISGRRASGSGSGGGGGISEITAQMITDALGYVPYSSLNPAGYITSAVLDGYAKTSDIPSLSGYATENWVSNNYQPKGNYLTSVAWGDVSGKPTTLGGYGITDALSTSGGVLNLATFGEFVVNSKDANIDRSAIIFKKDAELKAQIGWDNYMSWGTYMYNYLSDAVLGIKNDGTPHFNGYSLYHTGNFNPSDYLPKSGGTIEGGYALLQIKSASDVKLSLNNTDSDNKYQYIEFLQNDVRYGYLGTLGNDDLSWSGNIIIHSGNIGSQIVEGVFAGSNIGDANTVSFTNRALRWFSLIPSTTSNLPTTAGYQNGLLALPLHINGITAQWYFSYTKKPYYRSSQTSNWNEIAYVTDNVASATKLQTARSIWGQSFDGTGDVDGSIAIGGDRVLARESGAVWLNYGPANKNENLYLFGYDTQFYCGTASGYRLAVDVKPTGNVLIGTTDDNGRKLQVNGIVSANDYEGGSFSSTHDDSFVANNKTIPWYGLSVYEGYSKGVWVTGYTNVILYTSAGKLEVGGGLVSITGNLTATGEVITSRRATSSDARLKDNINRLIAEDCLAMVRNLQPSSWRWKEDGKFSLGFIAQDIEPLMPYAVTKIKDEELGQRLNLQYDQFIALAIGGVQAVDNEVQLLKKEVAELKQRLSKYETVWQ